MTGHCFGYNPAGGTRRRVQPGIEPVNTDDVGMGLPAGRAGTHVPGSAKIVPPLHRGKRLFENRLPGDISGDRIPRHDIPDGPVGELPIGGDVVINDECKVRGRDNGDADRWRHVLTIARIFPRE